MTLVEATTLLNECTRHELRDHAFGDREVSWEKEGVNVASGYFSGTTAEVYVKDTTFKNAEAYHLLTKGTLTSVERNDETGPEDYQDGKTMPGLTLEGVRKELEEQ